MMLGLMLRKAHKVLGTSLCLSLVGRGLRNDVPDLCPGIPSAAEERAAALRVLGLPSGWVYSDNSLRAAAWAVPVRDRMVLRAVTVLIGMEYDPD